MSLQVFEQIASLYNHISNSVSELGKPSAENDSLDERIRKSNSNSEISTATIEDEIEYFIRSKFMGPKLVKLVNHMKKVRPTSVNNERVFSIAGLICTQRRLQLQA